MCVRNTHLFDHMVENTEMVVFQTGILHLGCCIVFFLPAYGDYIISLGKSSLPIIITATQGENVVLPCNESWDKTEDHSWRKNGSLLYNYSPHMNKTVMNYSSSRMHVDPQNPHKLQISNVQLSDAGHYECFPLRQRWILIIEVMESKPLPLKDMLLYTVPLVTGLVVCLIIFCTVWIHRESKASFGSERNMERSLHNVHPDVQTICVYTNAEI
ncbi:uncharacterized protein LOC143511612 [Brachyhypopomus gauderio]|uniref:uncharacterized protein LOC143511612 n=1 Tax=Brachyhypopomus gauderio TaxID=698409 RepID=UPI0040433973